MPRRFSCLIAPLVFLVLAGCAHIYRGGIVGKIYIDSNNENREIFFLREQDFSGKIEPLQGAGAKKLRDEMLRWTTVQRTDQSLEYSAGYYILAFLCGDRLVHEPIQIPDAALSDGKPLRVKCPL